MKLKALIDKPGINLEKDTFYEVEDIVEDEWKIKIPMKQKNKFRYALVKEDEGELVD